MVLHNQGKERENTMDDFKTQWHPAFYSAMRLELADNKKDLEFETEHNINTKPIMIDLLVIRKFPDAVIHNEIGKIFKEYNIFEYKSPGDQMGIETFLKAAGYACLYLANADNAGKISEDNITISLVRREKPRKLIEQLAQKGHPVEESGKGIYQIKNLSFFTVQIIVSGELDEESHIWLKSLTRTLERETAKKLILTIGNLSEPDEKEYADSVLHVVAKENSSLIERMKGDQEMCEALKEIMKPEIEEMLKSGEQRAMEKGREKGREEGVNALGETIRRLKNGESAESISDSGIEQSIINLALSLI